MENIKQNAPPQSIVFQYTSADAMNPSDQMHPHEDRKINIRMKFVFFDKSNYKTQKAQD